MQSLDDETPVPVPATAPPLSTNSLEALFRTPSIDGMRKLSSGDFEKFVRFVLDHAGYRAKHTGPVFRGGVDIELQERVTSGRARRLGGVECKRYNGRLAVGKDPVQKLAGAKAIKGGLPGYLITTSTFTEPARQEAEGRPNIHLITGEQFVRYVDYVHGSVGTEHQSSFTVIAPNVVLNADRIMKQRPKLMPHILAIANNKGGVGKTTTARFLGLGLAAQQQHVLLIDLDAQANLTEFILGKGPDEITPPTLADYFAGTASLRDAVHQSTQVTGLSIIPAHPLLGRYDSGGFGRPDLELRFTEALYTAFAPQEGHLLYDWIILDTPPNVSLFTRTALAAADYVLVPARARNSSVRGTYNMLEAHKAMGALMGRAPRILGGLLTHWGEDSASEDAEARLQVALHGAGSDVLEIHIPVSSAIETSPNAARNAKHAYDELVQEVINNVSAH